MHLGARQRAGHYFTRIGIDSYQPVVEFPIMTRGSARSCHGEPDAGAAARKSPGIK
jgi:hypothetical protein